MRRCPGKRLEHLFRLRLHRLQDSRTRHEWLSMVVLAEGSTDRVPTYTRSSDAAQQPQDSHANHERARVIHLRQLSKLTSHKKNVVAPCKRAGRDNRKKERFSKSFKA